jgi:hypothetical protein
MLLFKARRTELRYSLGVGNVTGIKSIQWLERFLCSHQKRNSLSQRIQQVDGGLYRDCEQNPINCHHDQQRRKSFETGSILTIVFGKHFGAIGLKVSPSGLKLCKNT